MGEAGRVSDDTVAEVIEMLKEEREEFLDAVSGDAAYWQMLQWTRGQRDTEGGFLWEDMGREM